MALVHDDEEIVGEIIEQRIRRRPCRSMREVTRIILDARAVAHLLHHFKVVVRALLDALRLDELTLLLEMRDLRDLLLVDRRHGDLHVLLLRHIVRSRKNHRMRALAVDLSGQDVELKDALNLVAEKLDAHGAVIPARRKHFYDVAAHTKAAALKGDVVALVLNGDELAQDVLTHDRLPLVQRQDHLVIALWRAETVDARNARDDDAVAPLEERARRRVAQFINLVVDRRILFDVSVRRRNIRLGLVVVIIADKIADIILREERLELTRQLRRQRLVVRDDKRRLLYALNRLGDRVRLARARSAEEHLRLLPVLDARRQVPNRTRLIPHRLKRRRNLKRYLLIKLHRIELRQNRHVCASYKCCKPIRGSAPVEYLPPL